MKLLYAYFIHHQVTYDQVPDLVQETLLRLLKRNLNPDNVSAKYLYRVARCVYVDWLRRQKVRPKSDQQDEDFDSTREPISQQASVEENVMQKELLLKALACMTAAERELLWRVYAEECPIEDIARELGCSTNVIYVRLCRARQKLRDALKRLASSSPEVRRPQPAQDRNKTATLYRLS